MKLINHDSRTAEQCKCEVSIRHFKLILFSLLSLFFPRLFLSKCDFRAQ